MTHRARYSAVLSSLLCFAFFLSASDALAQAGKGLVGTWTLVTNVTTDATGKKEASYGEKPMGQISFSSNGRYTLIITRPDLPKFASNSRVKGTPDENKAVVGGMIAHYGTYTVDDKAKAIVFHIDSASFPNWNGTDQKRPYSVTATELKWNTPAASGGGSADLVWKRTK
jgi:Lipocalin-like domain